VATAGQAPRHDQPEGAFRDRGLRVDHPARILVAEDTEDNRVLLIHYLRGEPARLRFATTGTEAVERIRGGDEFDLILMDIDLPGLDGYEATRAIREFQMSRSMPLTPIVALSAHAMREAVRASLDAGCVAHVAKPIDRTTLLRTIRRYSSRPDGVVPGVEALVPRYLASNAKRIEEAHAHLASGDFEPIRRLGHNLKGTGRGYGFPRIEELGREIETAASLFDRQRVAGQLEALERFIEESEGVPSAP